MANLKRSKYYNDWLTFVEKIKDSNNYFGPTVKGFTFTIGSVARNLEWASILSSGWYFDLGSAHTALGFFDSALDRFYSIEAPTFQGIRQELQDDTISSSCAAFVLLTVSSYVSYNITRYEVDKLSNSSFITRIFDASPYDIKINNKVLNEAAHMAPFSNQYAIKSDEDLKLFM